MTEASEPPHARRGPATAPEGAPSPVRHRHSGRTMAIALVAALAWAVAAPADPAPTDPAPTDPAPAGAAQGAIGEAGLDRRVISIDSSGGTQRGNLRFGPIVYEHPEEDGIVATVSTLTIRGRAATLRGPEDTPIGQAQGRRTAEFDGGVIVSRGRLVAVGTRLVYSEETGQGVLEGSAEIRIAPSREGEDPVVITAGRVTFDVDTDVSVSEGDVRLVNGDQTATADRLVFEEARELGALASEGGRAVVTRAGDDGDLRIEGDEIRVLTEIKALYARGDVVVEDGPVTSRGEEVFYDDDEEVAEVLGAPARAVDTAAGVTLETDRIRQDVRYRFVEAIDATVATAFTPEQFALTAERPAGP